MKKDDEYDDYVNAIKIQEPEMRDILSVPEDLPVVIPKQEPIIKAREEVEVTDDFEKARGNLHDILEKGHDALDNLIEVAKESESARCYEVVGQLIKVLVDANEKLISVHKQKKDIGDLDPEATKREQSVQNNLFVGSTQDLQLLLNELVGNKKGKRKSINDDDDEQF